MKKIKKQSLFHPLQSELWGEFRKAWGNKILWTEFGLVTIHPLPFTKYSIGMFIKGPEPSQEMLSALKKMGKENNLIFIKLEPNFPVSINHQPLTINHSQNLVNLFEKNGALPGKTLFTPTTFWIDLTKPEEELLRSFSSKTRYNIRLAQKYGVTVKEDNSQKAFNKYLELTRETVERQGFYAHSEKYHRLMWKFLHTEPIANGQQPIAHLLTATYKKKIITCWIVFLYKDILYYPYGASSDAHKQVMANNLIMWEAIKFGKKMGAKIFDLWGREEGKGFTKFKEGYNPQVIEFLGTWDLIINPLLYRVYRILENLRWKFLRLRAKVSPVKPTF